MLRYSVIVYFALATALHAQTVYVNSHIVALPVAPFPSETPFEGGIHFLISKNGQPPPFHVGACFQVECDTEIWFQYKDARIKVHTWILDEGSDWFLVQPGDTFSRATIDAGQFPTIINLLSTPPVVLNEVTVGSGDFYLGVSTGKASIADSRPRTVYGWVHLRPVDGVLTMVENVMSYNSRGIIVGTTTVVPEPATWLLACSALCGVRRHRR